MTPEDFLKEAHEKNPGFNGSIFLPPTTAEHGLNTLINHFLGADWISMSPVKHEQVITEAVLSILEQNQKPSFWGLFKSSKKELQKKLDDSNRIISKLLVESNDLRRFQDLRRAQLISLDHVVSSCRYFVSPSFKRDFELYNSREFTAADILERISQTLGKYDKACVDSKSEGKELSDEEILNLDFYDFVGIGATLMSDEDKIKYWRNLDKKAKSNK